MIAEPVGSYPHITVGDDRAPSITGTTTKVIEIALDRIAYHWDADEIQRQHSHLSLAQIHAALAYYYDHQSELDAVIAAQLERVTELRQRTEDTGIRKILLQARNVH